MRVVVTAENERGLDSDVAGHFGHASYFAVVMVEDGQVSWVSAHANPFALEHKPGQVPNFVKSLGAQVMITGGMGENAAKVFEKLGIQAFSGAKGRVAEAVEVYIAGGLPAASDCAHEGHGDAHAHAEVYKYGQSGPINI